MSWTSLNPLLYMIYILVSGLIGFIVKRLLDRLDKIEADVELTVSNTEVRQLLADKLDPIKEDVQEIKESVQNITAILMTPKRSYKKSKV